MVSKSEFDELIRKEMRNVSTSQRGGDSQQAARDRVARRLNAQEGRSRNSTAYTPGPNKPAKSASSGGKGVTQRKKGPGTRKPGGGGGLPATTDVVPTARPPGPGEDQSMRGGILAAIMAAALAAAGGARALRGRGGAAAAAAPEAGRQRMPWEEGGGAAPTEQSPTRYPWDQPSAPAAEPPPTRAPAPDGAPVDPATARVNSAFGEVAPEDVGGLNEQQIRDIINRAAGMPSGVETGGDVGGRVGPNVYRPGIDAPAPAPGLHGSKFGQPIVKPPLPDIRFRM